MRNILRLRVLGILLIALGLFGGTAATALAADATPPADSDTASLAISAFWSDQVAKPTLTEASASANLPDGAGFIEATFSVYINGDLLAEPWATVTTTNGDAQVIDALPVGTHKLVLDGAVGFESPYTWAWDVTVTEGAATVVTVLVPWGDTPGNSDLGSLVLTSYGADQVVTPQFFVSPPINITPEPAEEIAASGFDLPYEGAYVVDREFLVYINGDLNSVPLTLQTQGGTALADGLPEGTHLLVDAQTEYSIEFDIAQGSITTIVAVFPEGTGDSGDPEDPDTEAPGGDDGSDDGSDDGTDDGGDVTKLPNTGQTGNGSDSGSLAIVLGAMSLLALAGAYAWRQRRTA